MSDRLIAAVENALSRLAQEVHQDASVLVQYAAGDWTELKAALSEAKGEDYKPGVLQTLSNSAAPAPEAATPVPVAEPAAVDPEPASEVITPESNVDQGHYTDGQGVAS